jgi:choice-of-anchor B domain-containing protein
MFLRALIRNLQYKLKLKKVLKRTLLICALLAHALSANSQLNLTLLSNYAYPGSRGDCSDIWGHVDSLGNEYAIVGNNNGTSIMDVTDPANPVEVFFTSGPSSTWRDIKVWDDVAYITNESSGGLKIIDMSSLPGTIVGADVYSYGGSTYQFDTAHDFYVDEVGRGYVLGADNGVGGAIILDLFTDPLAPTELGRYNDFYLHDAFVRGDTLWGGAIDDGIFVVVDVSDPGTPATMATQFTPNTFTHNVWASDDGNYVFTTDEISGAFIGAYDVSDLANIFQVDQIQSSPGNGVIPHNTFVNGNYVVTSYYRDGITIHDVTYPGNMIEVGNYDTSPLSGEGFNGLWGVYPYLPSGNLIGSDIEGGLFVWAPTYVPGAYLEGNITDVVTTAVLNNAQIDIVSTTNSDLTDILGDYATGVGTGGTFTVTVSKLGYVTETVTGVILTNGLITTLDVALVPLPTYTLEGSVIDFNSDPIINAQVKITDGAFTTTVTTNGLGEFSIPGFLEGPYDVFIGKWGYHSSCALNESLLISNNPHVYQLADGYSDDFALHLGWSVSTTASTGDWERGIPVGTTSSGDQSNPDADATGDCGEEAYITGNGGGGAGNDDVDDGETVLYSPLFDLTTYIDPYIEFDRWFFNAGGFGSPNDSLVVRLTNGSATVIIDFAVENDPGVSTWAAKNVHVTDFITPTAFMQMQITTMDQSPGHLSEGGFDKFMVVEAPDAGISALGNVANVSIYPSPFNENLTIESTSSADEISIEVYEMTSGRKVDTRSFENSPLISFENNYAKGIYLIRVYGDDQLLKIEKVVKM